MSEFASQFIEMLSNVDVYPEMVCAIRCLRADGVKTALLTNNFNLSIRRHMSLIDASLFDVVSTDVTFLYWSASVVTVRSLASIHGPCSVWCVDERRDTDD